MESFANYLAALNRESLENFVLTLLQRINDAQRRRKQAWREVRDQTQLERDHKAQLELAEAYLAAHRSKKIVKFERPETSSPPSVVRKRAAG